MRLLIVEDDFTSRKILQNILSAFGECDIAVDGNEAINAYKESWLKNNPYDLICMDIMMPNVDGLEALKTIRDIEKEMDVKDRDGVKVIMTTALDDPKTVVKSYYQLGATSYIVKPLSKQKLIQEVEKLGLINQPVKR
jgi:two-component system chemotaxis response regulator CheY